MTVARSSAEAGPIPVLSTGMGARIVAEARSWIGTPWRHQAAIQAAIKGVGADCVGFVRCATEPFVGKVTIVIDYTRTWPLYRAEPRTYHEFAARCEKVPLDRLMPSDILLFGFGKGPAHHCGYAAPGSPIIHCHREVSAVVEQDLTDWWHRKLRHAFRVPGIRG